MLDISSKFSLLTVTLLLLQGVLLNHSFEYDLNSTVRDREVKLVLFIFKWKGSAFFKCIKQCYLHYLLFTQSIEQFTVQETSTTASKCTWPVQLAAHNEVIPYTLTHSASVKTNIMVNIGTEYMVQLSWVLISNISGTQVKPTD